MDYNILLDLASSNNLATNIRFNTANRSVRFSIRVVNGGVEIPYMNYDKASLIFRRPNRTASERQCLISPTGIVCDADPNDYSANGEVFCELWLYRGEMRAAPLYFSFNVQRTILPREFLDSINQSDAFDAIIAELQRLITDLPNQIEIYTTEMDQLLAQFRAKISVSEIEIDQLVLGAQGKFAAYIAEIERITAEASSIASGVLDIYRGAIDGMLADARQIYESYVQAINILVNKAEQDYIEYSHEIGKLEYGAEQAYTDLIQRISELKASIMITIDQLFITTEARADEWIEKLRKEFERQHEAMEGIVAGDFTTNELFNRHRHNGDADSQHYTIVDGFYKTQNKDIILTKETINLFPLNFDGGHFTDPPNRFRDIDGGYFTDSLNHERVEVGGGYFTDRPSFIFNAINGGYFTDERF